jgi:ornithine cyclodeaminase/alanine dehydrogenase-like protein (mu-crystallin family)
VPIYLNEEDVAEFLDMPTAIQALRDAFAARARNEGNVIPRTRWEFGDRRLNVMGGGLAPQRRFAVKSYGSSAFHVLLYSEQDGLLAIIEANLLGQIRTGAASAVASEKMARAGASKVGLIGTGRQARTQALALSSAGLLEEIAVYGRKRDKLEAFCAKLGPELNAAAHPARSAEEAVADADIVTAATNSATPVVMASWLKPGVHVNGIGANAANRREIDPEIVLKASLVVTDDIPQAKTEAAEFIDLTKAGKLDWSRVRALHELVTDSTTRDPDALTLFKSLGVGLEDVAVASIIYDRAEASGRFKPL